MGRTIFINRYFYPDHSATSQILSDLAFHMAASGKNVCVITSQQRYDDPTARLPQRETIRGVEVQRIMTTHFGRSGLTGRTIDYLSFYSSAWRALHRSVSPNDFIVAKTDPPLLSIIAAQVSRARGAHLVNWLQDLYPEVAIAFGVPLVRGPLAAAISYLRDRSLKVATANVAVGEIMAERIKSRGVSPDVVHVIPNWNDDDAIRPIAPDESVFRERWGLAEKFVVGYSGNLGRAHEFDTILAASERLRDRSDIVFLLIGGGHRFDELIRAVKERHLEQNYRFVPYQDNSVLGQTLSVPDVHWISIVPTMEGLIVPSKFYGIAAAGRPIISITDQNGEIARLVSQYKCGVVIQVGKYDELAQQIAALSADPERVSNMGRRARKMLDAEFSRRRAFERWNALFESAKVIR